MSDQNSNYLRNELKEFINSTKILLDNKENSSEETDLTLFAEKIWNLHHFSEQLLEDRSANETTLYNARIIKDLTEAPIYQCSSSKNSCSLVFAADRLKNNQEFSAIRNIMGNLINDQMASEVLLDDLAVIYKELAA